MTRTPRTHRTTPNPPTGPREITTPFRPIPVTVPEGMRPNEFFNSPENLADLEHNNGLLRTPENLLLYRKALGHSTEFDCSILYNTAQQILDPLGRPVRRTQLPPPVRRIWNRANAIVIGHMLQRYPDPEAALVLAGEASLDATWPLTSPGVPSIRMLHNHFIVFPMAQLRAAPLANPDDPNLTDGGQHSLFQAYMRDVYRRFLDSALQLKTLRLLPAAETPLPLTGYPQGLPSWEIVGGLTALSRHDFWTDYDAILQGFLDFYRTFFGQVSSRNAELPQDLFFADAVANHLLGDRNFQGTAKRIREHCLADARYAAALRWQPAFKQLIYRDARGRLIVTISQNSIGNAITELLGIVVRRIPDEAAYAAIEPALIERLLAVRAELMSADIGQGLATASWPAT